MKDDPIMDLTPDTLFSDSALWQSWLDVEAALARAQAGIGMIPAWAAKDITRHARIDAIGEDRLRASIAQTMAPILSLTRCACRRCRRGGALCPLGRDHAERHADREAAFDPIGRAEP